jgi:transcriptional regulator with XRE-family HTH domain
MALISGFSQQYLSSLENGRRNPAVVILYELATAIALVASLSLVAAASDSPVQHKKSHVAKNHVKHHWHGYGFLPGYRPPEVVDREREEHYYRLYGPQYYGPVWPGFYRGRWNGGGFGPCWTQTPIGPMWNCGK